MKLIVGLGNPGKKYEKTRHNVGFMAIDNILEKNNIQTKDKFNGLLGEMNVSGEKILLLKPQTYMNTSGQSIRQVMDFYKIDKEDVLVIFDDLDLPTGKIRLRAKGGSGGHNGLKSIEAHLGGKDYKRIKVGIDNDKQMYTPDYVLGRFGKEDMKSIQNAVEIVYDIVFDFTKNDFVSIMNNYN